MEENLEQVEQVENEDTQSVNVEEVEITDTEIVSHDSQIENFEEKTFTQAEIDTLQAQVDELSQYKPKELTEDETKIQQKLEQIWSREVNQTLKEEGLEIFADFIKADVDDNDNLHIQIKKIKEIVGKLELANGYQPTSHKPVDAYSLAKKNKDTKKMISAKLNQ